MPTEPPETSWAFPPVETSSPEGIVGMGADLEPGTLLAAYRNGIFPMPLQGDVAWWSPDPRAVIPLENWQPSGSLRKSIRRYSTTVDQAFRDVMLHCADPDRPHGWITDEFVEAYVRLHELGWAHSFEVWHDGTLVGGLYGVSSGGLFAGESMFHLKRDASKVAMDRVVSWMTEHGKSLFDVQWLTPHLESLGAVEMGREEYMERLDRVL